jgi:hypothetical protein
MLEAFTKMRSHEYFLESIVLILIISGLLFLFFKIVIPNMGVKAVPASWLTAFGATLILAYTIFYDLKAEIGEKDISTRVIYSLNWEPINCLVDHERAFMSLCTGLMEAKRDGLIKLNEIRTADRRERLSIAPSELVILNVVDHLTSTVRDWRITGVSTPLGSQVNFRQPAGAQGERVFVRDEILKNECQFKTIDVRGVSKKDNMEDWLDGYAIWPKFSSIDVKENKVVVNNPNFIFEVHVFPGNGATRVDDIGHYTTVSDSESGCWLTSQQVTIRYVLKKSRAGHWMRGEYKSFCEWLSESLASRLEAPPEKWPRVIEHVDNTQHSHAADGRSSRS